MALEITLHLARDKGQWPFDARHLLALGITMHSMTDDKKTMVISYDGYAITDLNEKEHEPNAAVRAAKRHIKTPRSHLFDILRRHGYWVASHRATNLADI